MLGRKRSATEDKAAPKLPRQEYGGGAQDSSPTPLITIDSPPRARTRTPPPPPPVSYPPRENTYHQNINIRVDSNLTDAIAEIYVSPQFHLKAEQISAAKRVKNPISISKEEVIGASFPLNVEPELDTKAFEKHPTFSSILQKCDCEGAKCIFFVLTCSFHEDSPLVPGSSLYEKTTWARNFIEIGKTDTYILVHKSSLTKFLRLVELLAPIHPVFQQPLHFLKNEYKCDPYILQNAVQVWDLLNPLLFEASLPNNLTAQEARAFWVTVVLHCNNPQGGLINHVLKSSTTERLLPQAVNRFVVQLSDNVNWAAYPSLTEAQKIKDNWERFSFILSRISKENFFKDQMSTLLPSSLDQKSLSDLVQTVSRSLESPLLPRRFLRQTSTLADGQSNPDKKQMALVTTGLTATLTRVALDAADLGRAPNRLNPPWEHSSNIFSKIINENFSKLLELEKIVFTVCLGSERAQVTYDPGQYWKQFDQPDPEKSVNVLGKVLDRVPGIEKAPAIAAIWPSIFHNNEQYFIGASMNSKSNAYNFSPDPICRSFEYTAADVLKSMSENQIVKVNFKALDSRVTSINHVSGRAGENCDDNMLSYLDCFCTVARSNKLRHAMPVFVCVRLAYTLTTTNELFLFYLEYCEDNMAYYTDSKGYVNCPTYIGTVYKTKHRFVPRLGADLEEADVISATELIEHACFLDVRTLMTTPRYGEDYVASDLLSKFQGEVDLVEYVTYWPLQCVTRSKQPVFFSTTQNRWIQEQASLSQYLQEIMPQFANAHADQNVILRCPMCRQELTRSRVSQHVHQHHRDFLLLINTRDIFISGSRAFQLLLMLLLDWIKSNQELLKSMNPENTQLKKQLSRERAVRHEQEAALKQQSAKIEKLKAELSKKSQDWEQEKLVLNTALYKASLQLKKAREKADSESSSDSDSGSEEALVTAAAAYVDESDRLKNQSSNAPVSPDIKGDLADSGATPAAAEKGGGFLQTPVASPSHPEDLQSSGSETELPAADETNSHARTKSPPMGPAGAPNDTSESLTPISAPEAHLMPPPPPPPLTYSNDCATAAPGANSSPIQQLIHAMTPKGYSPIDDSLLDVPDPE